MSTKKIRKKKYDWKNANTNAAPKKDYKWLILAGAIVVIAAVIFVVILGRAPKGLDPKGYYDGNPWGTSIEEINQKYEGTGRMLDFAISDNDLYIFEDNYLGLTGVDGTATLTFDENGLSLATVLIAGADADIYNAVATQLLNAYGNPYQAEEADAFFFKAKQSYVIVDSFDPEVNDSMYIIYRPIEK